MGCLASSCLICSLLSSQAEATEVICTSRQTKREKTGLCVNKPWSDFRSCADEADQGACIDGNSWVDEHCTESCAGAGSIPSSGTLLQFLGPLGLVCYLCCALGAGVYWIRKRRQ